jgi:hypothetical protein
MQQTGWLADVIDKQGLTRHMSRGAIMGDGLMHHSTPGHDFLAHVIAIASIAGTHDLSTVPII